MVIVIIIAALTLISIAAVVITKSGGSSVALPGRDRFRYLGPGKVKLEDKPRAAGLN